MGHDHRHHEHNSRREHAHPREAVPERADDHDHAHDHHHVHGPPQSGRAFAVGIALNLAFVFVEVGYGLVAHSLALVADAGHNLGDVLGLGLSWGATALAQLKPSTRRTFGYRRTTIVASVVNALVLVFVTGGLTWESIGRLRSPGAAPEGRTMIAVALAGTVINTASALLFLHGREKDLNLRGAFLHLASDAVLAAGVAASGVVILFTGWTWLDPAVSIVLAVTIFAGTWSLMKRSFNLILDAVPEGINPEHVRAFLGGLPHVVEVHDLHIWAMSTTETALTAHLVMPNNVCKPSFLGEVCSELHAKFDIDHATLQIDPEDAPSPCMLAPEEHV